MEACLHLWMEVVAECVVGWSREGKTDVGKG